MIVVTVPVSWIPVFKVSFYFACDASVSRPISVSRSASSRSVVSRSALRRPSSAMGPVSIGGLTGTHHVAVLHKASFFLNEIINFTQNARHNKRPLICDSFIFIRYRQHPQRVLQG